ncbi:hypothetical protein PybrP1_000249 [[Pythium] brassicae (nom. inval.)]|nr:hypothetical protein PybrP1_000249 [[Pythium] brassicae (nom. inval.)]
MATPSFVVRGHAAATAAASSSSSGGASAIDVDAYAASDACPFLARGAAGSSPMLDGDDELLDDAESDVFRSTPLLQPYAAFAPLRERDFYAGGGQRDSALAPEFVANPVTASTFQRDPATQIGRKIEFSSIAEDFPLAATSKACIVPIRPTSYRPCGVEAAAATTVTSTQLSRAGDYSVSGRVTPVMNPVADASQPEEMALAYRTNSLERDSDDDRKSPFGDSVLQPPKLYQYRATKTEIDDMEILRWGIQEKVFHRYFAFQQREPQWGSLEMRDNRLMFHPGKRREAIVHEKKFHEATYREGIADGDAAWYMARRAHFGEVYREFCREEMKHKQEAMLTRLEKNSMFSKFPILGNRFLLVRLLGKGGNGEVWTVVDYADNKRSCALKLSTSIKHAQHEHLTHSRLKHPNIVNVGSTAYLIEYRQQYYTAFTVDSVETDLQQLIEIYEHFDETSALKVLLQLLKALEYLHNEPISSSSVGTLRYLPPECFRPGFGDCGGTAEKADMWMVGIVFCLMLWGKHPICSDKSSHDAAKASLARYSGELTHTRPVSSLSQWIVHGCLHPDPRCRPTARQLLQVLDASSPPAGTSRVVPSTVTNAAALVDGLLVAGCE